MLQFYEIDLRYRYFTGYFMVEKDLKVYNFIKKKFQHRSFSVKYLRIFDYVLCHISPSKHLLVQSKQ